MSDVNNVGGSPYSSIQSDPSYLSSPEFKALPSFVQDTLIQAFTTDELNTRFAAVGAPTLSSPTTIDESMNTFFRLLAEARRSFKQQLSASDFIDQSTRSKSSQSAALQALSLSSQFATRDRVVEKTASDSQTAINQLQAQLDLIQQQVNDQKDAIAFLNAGNAQEQQKFAELTQAYTSFVTGVRAIPGVVDLGNGSFTIPAGKESQYNALVATYQQEVNTFNAYWSGRLSQINSYNTRTNTYNVNQTINNQDVQDFIDEYDLESYMARTFLNPPPEQPSSDTRSTTGYQSAQAYPSSLATGPATLYSYPPPTYASDIATSGPPTIPTIPAYPSYNAQPLYDGVYQKNYDNDVVPVDQVIISNVLYWSFLRLQILHSPPDSTPDPLLNFKPIARRLVQAAIIDPTQPIKADKSQGSGSLSVEAMGLGSPHIQAIMGKANLAQVINNLKLDLTDEQRAQLVDQLLLLSTGLIGNASVESLLPSLDPIAALLAALPKDSPAISLLFSVAFSNSIQEAIAQGLTLQALQTLIGENPLLQNLSAEDAANLAAALNIGLLLVSAKLLEASLGLPDLLATILPPLLPPPLLPSFLEQVNQEQEQSQQDLIVQLQSHFIAQGLPEDKANFLTQFSVDLVNQGLLAPTTPSVSLRSVNEQILADSIKANLILSDSQELTLDQATFIAQEALQRTFEEESSNAVAVSPSQFRADLETNLKDLGISSALASQISKEAIVIPPFETLTASTVPTTQSEPAKSHLPLAALLALVPEFDLLPTLERRAYKLLVPQLGAELAKIISQKIAITLFGDPNPDSRDVADVKSPLSVINAIRNQLYHLKVEQNEQHALATSDAFKNTLLTTTDFYDFSLKVMDPAYLFIYSANTGIMYGGHETSSTRRSIDIIV